MLYKYFLIAVVMVSIYGCKKDFKSEKEYYQYANEIDNGLIKSDSSSGLKLSVMYKPWELMAKQDIKGVKKISQEVVDSIKKNYSQFYYFNLYIAGNEGDLRTQKFKNLSSIDDISYNIKDMVEIITSNGDTLNAVDLAYARMYDATDNLKILFVFERQKCESAKSFDFNILTEYSKKSRLRFFTEDIKNIPSFSYP